ATVCADAGAWIRRARAREARSTSRQLRVGTSDQACSIGAPPGPRDPSVYAKSITFSMSIALQTDTEMLEGFCENHHKSRERMVSTKAADIVQVPGATLSWYVGTYDTTNDGKNHFVPVT